jgi:hypothetical protein
LINYCPIELCTLDTIDVFAGRHRTGLAKAKEVVRRYENIVAARENPGASL